MRTDRTRSAVPPGARGAWLSLFAMLMIFIGPLISQSMPMEHHAGMSTPVSTSMGSGEHHAHHGGEHASPAETGMSDHALWAKCGYCTLLFSCPALSRVITLVAATPPKPSDFFAALTRQGHARQSAFLHARSRAPPATTTA
ncbi:DUF2946 domain-containing protein [Pseudomonas capsici]|uniref:DUF2946 domain-containing protein n=2 Tax=Pseudomonas capsici TaxID=2810614 RepID=A0ABT3C129_9PSED|nr:DUF2946 domain-containing protein [Pseudomonas capsici]MBN6716641.1 DUF2946 domain-containing protein [Pseudomonas capsici]MBN6721475.1 DUF2946 domain-containing protein [Pseudomonas capsici]MBN6726473.1 DUF2946 domain-containing protein [Pseudomonas capsici]MCV4269816.1 DUF2946 domain-containing protein [Pseudomonas capsici]MCV4280292.1 DUF2946 domain-containing protein [Pseudomonas capsici]